MNRLEELSLKFLDRTASESEVQELSELVSTSTEKNLFVEFCELEARLLALNSPPLADKVVAEIKHERCRQIEDNVMRSVSEVSQAETSANLNRNSYRTAQRLGITVAAMILVYILLRLNQDINKNNTLAQLHSHHSLVRVLDANGQLLPPSQTNQPISLFPEQTVETSQAIDTAEIVFDDGTVLELYGETKVKLSISSEGCKQFNVFSGLIRADVAPQPKQRPLRILTETATLEVLGTTLGVEVRDTMTQLGVADGRVAMTRKADGQRVEVIAGRYATATESVKAPLQSHPFPELPKEWSEDFEEGLPMGWRAGELVSIDDQRVVCTIKSTSLSSEHFVISTQNAWQEGNHALCQIDENSVLHIRFRQSSFARMTIMIGTRFYPPANGGAGANLFYTRKDWNRDLQPDAWRTISIPLREVSWHVKQGQQKGGPPELSNLAAYLIHITTMEEEIGLCFDRIWITNEREGTSL